jgi:nitroimidazol reductase NimA-like FMN-containing flavoprotein (pyridoxamine 5'-phosphate oxidase superfamily)
VNDQNDGGASERQRAAQPQVDRPQAPSVYGFSRADGPLLSWEYVEERLRTARNYWLATVYPDGRPHVTPVWGAWVDGMLYVSGFPQARWARNLAANPAVAAHLESGDEVVIVEGAAEDVVTDAELGERIIAAWDAKYGRLAPKPASDGICRIRPRTVRAWTDTESFADAARWTWADATHGTSSA